MSYINLIFYYYYFFFKYTMKEQNFFPAVQDPDAAHRYMRWLCTYTIFYPYCLLYIDTAQGSRINYNRVSTKLFSCIAV